jgi:transposase
MTEQKRSYTKEFKMKAVELSNLKGSLHQVAQELDIPAKNLSRWKQEHRLGKFDDSFKPDKTKSTIELENIALKKSMYEIKLENDILKKALAIFAKKDR